MFQERRVERHGPDMTPGGSRAPDLARMVEAQQNTIDCLAREIAELRRPTPPTSTDHDAVKSSGRTASRSRRDLLRLAGLGAAAAAGGTMLTSPGIRGEGMPADGHWNGQIIRPPNARCARGATLRTAAGPEPADVLTQVVGTTTRRCRGTS
jgi:hypothetical protein